MTGINGYIGFMGNNLRGLTRYDSVESDIKDGLKLAMDSIKNRTLNQLLDSDREYQRRSEEERAARIMPMKRQNLRKSNAKWLTY